MTEARIAYKDLKALLDARDYAGCLELSERFIAQRPEHPSGYEFKALALLALKRPEAALPAVQQAIRRASPRINGTLWRRAAGVLKAAKTPATEQAAFWAACEGPIEQALEAARQGLLAGDAAAAAATLPGLDEQVFPPEAKDRLAACFALLGGTEPDGAAGEDPEAIIAGIRQPPILLAAGMGWSGSSAIFDYLAEFDRVTAVKGETPFISRGAVSLASIDAALEKPAQLRVQLVDFLFLNLLGFARITGGSDLKTFAYARARSIGAGQMAHLDAVLAYCRLARCLLQAAEPDDRLRAFAAMVKLVVVRFAIGAEVPAGHYALMDNVVPIAKIGRIGFLTETTVYCCFRDPRSNYVSRLREDVQFVKTPAKFIAELGKALERLEKRVEKSARDPAASCRFLRVQFEEFILSERYRDALARELGLDLSERQRHSRLKPWESLRNVMLHQEHEKPDEIALIEAELGGYCVEPAIRPLSRMPR